MQETDRLGFFCSRVPESESSCGVESPPLAQSHMSAVSFLLILPELIVSSGRDKTRDEVDELSGLDSCELIWEKRVGFAQTPVQVNQHHHNRTELLRPIITCFTQVGFTLFSLPSSSSSSLLLWRMVDALLMWQARGRIMLSGVKNFFAPP